MQLPVRNSRHLKGSSSGCGQRSRINSCKKQPAAFRKKGTSSRFLTHNFSCRRVNVLFLWCYVLTHKFSFHCEKDCLRSPDCEKTGQLAARKRYASERACFRPSTAQIPVKIYRSNAKSYSTNDTHASLCRIEVPGVGPYACLSRSS